MSINSGKYQIKTLSKLRNLLHKATGNLFLICLREIIFIKQKSLSSSMKIRELTGFR